MNDVARVEELPLIERINTMTDKRRENRKNVSARLRTSWCVKMPYTRKQALGARAIHLKRGVPFLRIYKCPKKACGTWHLTHKPERQRSFPHASRGVAGGVVYNKAHEIHPLDGPYHTQAQEGTT